MPDTPDRVTWKRHILLALIGVLLLALYVYTANPASVLDAIQRVNAPTLALATAFGLAAIIPRVWSLKRLSKGSTFPLSLRQSTRASLGSNTLNLLLPLRLGDAMLIASLSRESDTATTTALILSWRALSLLALALLAAVTLTFAAFTPSAGLTTLTLAILVALAASSLTAYLLPVATKNLRTLATLIGNHLEDRLQRTRAWVKNLLNTLQHATNPHHAATPTMALTLVWVADIALVTLFILTIDPTLSLLLAFTAPIIANIGKLIRLTPGGIGIYEGILAALLTAGGMTLPSAVAAATLGHLYLNLITVLTGLLPAASISHRTSLTAKEILHQATKEDPTTADLPP